MEESEYITSIENLLDGKGALKSTEIECFKTCLFQANGSLVKQNTLLKIVDKTIDKEFIQELLQSCLWSVLSGWLKRWHEDNEQSMCLQILSVFYKLPISLKLLKIDSTPKFIKKYGRNATDLEVRSLCNSIVDAWKKFIEGQCNITKVDEKKVKRKIYKEVTKPLESRELMNALDNAISLQRVEVVKKKRRLVKKPNQINPLIVEPIPNIVITNGSKESDKTSESMDDTASSNDSHVNIPFELKSILRHSAVGLCKKVSWVDDENLQTVHVFDFDPNERVNVNRILPSPVESTHHLLKMDSIPSSQTNLSENDDENVVLWRKPHKITGVEHLKINSRCTSEEESIQNQYQKMTLATIYFTKNTIPPSAAEPDDLNYTKKEPILINASDGGEVIVSKYTPKYSTVPITKPTTEYQTPSPRNVNFNMPPPGMLPVNLQSNTVYNLPIPFNPIQFTPNLVTCPRPSYQNIPQYPIKTITICPFYVRGMCKFGVRCKHPHPKPKTDINFNSLMLDSEICKQCKPTKFDKETKISKFDTSEPIDPKLSVLNG
ncbi:hypothetical protein A3Q56_06260 [Intoshia linei]|uniref:Serine/threonine-protein phosphatase 1 regulatory subunit 10 n=1 Tax=Intoshia linei TaxID=1819745 RepID=A0A177AX59_9BILA|nr:hypothetical protein A3Q56_06260 [Intoshia linei]